AKVGVSVACPWECPGVPGSARECPRNARGMPEECPGVPEECPRNARGVEVGADQGSTFRVQWELGNAMIVVASAGLNLSRELLAHCRIEETPQQIVVDGTLHEVRSVTSSAMVQKWLETAAEPPYPLGSSAPEYINLLNDVVKR